jgi:hypothetical protein
MTRIKKAASIWAHAGPEPRLGDLLSDSIVIAVMKKDKIKYPELLRLIREMRMKFIKKSSPEHSL